MVALLPNQPAPGNEGLGGDEQRAGREEVGDPFPPNALLAGGRPAPTRSSHLDNTALFEEVCQILQGHIIIESLHIN